MNASVTVVRIEVYDNGGGEPHLRPAERSGPRSGGWGLLLVDQLVDMWGTVVRPGRTIVWAQRAIKGGSVTTLQPALVNRFDIPGPNRGRLSTTRASG